MLFIVLSRGMYGFLYIICTTLRTIQHVPNNALQVTFDPPPTFSDAKTAAASKAAELRRHAPRKAESGNFA